ncbi:[protein-PII] uridylyltransferase [Pseudohalioglobus lutimaris]|uniref:Bifunctional uridylyltransferase/uridylyl-removing enzyme n=1 Tax=Pseudohalioglobus lutimaris TaxID=1737061 RepID=A0A2N5WYY1_9GAMM|nr:[protein-PII] uridylyltransferase [Pseudohalioglobus lutimaris]PLW67454.1 [protein-PII] uridylyltransferase [Pseudohalioglobus lutimaris]
MIVAVTPLPSLPREAFDPKAFARGLDEGQPLVACKDAISQCTEFLHRQFRAGADAGLLIRQRAVFMDQMLGALWDNHGWDSTDLALVAVGGYGRGELHPHSDIDILLLLGADYDPGSGQIEGFLTRLWDIGLDIGHSVRTVQECVDAGRDDITILTNLMEARVLRGPESLMQEVRQLTGPTQMWSSAEFFRAKLDEQRARHTKFADTEYNLEPNVKSSPGGLRDLQTISWIAERHFGVESLDRLTTEAFLNAEEMKVLKDGREFMWKVRYALHMVTGREEDRLLFDHQRELAGIWGLEDGDKLAVENFMQVYYRWAQALSMLNEVLIQNFDQAFLTAAGAHDVQELNGRFQMRNGYIEARNDNVFKVDPSAILEVFLLSARNDAINGIAAPTIRLLRNSLHLIDDNFRASDINKRMFIELLRSPYKLTRQLKRMLRYGVLGRYIPAFGRIIGQMQHDMFHAYTVDAHTLEVIENMRRFQIPEFAERFPVTSRVACRLPKIELLYLSGLFHDIGKGRGGDHSELGAVDARAFCEDHGLSKRDTNLVTWLVESHLTMSAVSQRRDISDPDVILQFAQHVGDENRLDYLFALTVADINGTNPTLWNAWRGSLLRQLYTETKRALRRGLENPIDKQVWVDETRDAAIDSLEYRGFTVEELQELWKERGEDYFLREKSEDIAWHTEAIAGHHDKSKPLVVLRSTLDSSVANTTQIFIHARSTPQLFPRICAQLEQLDLSVHDARIYNANDGMTLDTFFVLSADGSSIAEDSARLNHIREHLTETLGDYSEAKDDVQRRTPRAKKSFSVPTETKMSVDEIKNYSVLEVSTPDRPGLLARISRIFVDFGIELQAAKIQTLGERVEDVFFITDHKQQPITDPAMCEAIQRAVREELDEQAVA